MTIDLTDTPAEAAFRALMRATSTELTANAARASTTTPPEIPATSHFRYVRVAGRGGWATGVFGASGPSIVDILSPGVQAGLMDVIGCRPVKPTRS